MKYLSVFSGLECAHIDGKTKPDAHDKTVSLGAWHHMGTPHEGWTRHSMRVEYGPSLAEGSKPFHAKFGSNKQLLERQNAILGIDTATTA